ncbi:MAG: flagellar biosynthesis protein FlhF [Betaproteobacteria bacterium]|nr:flagellar biosynthesis protein FlhF [Betaproteobacteria bacterium]MDE2131316.1 flagellar biosynthesis protein FlhF [Betaproteobacteria bacterium]MDE2212479.1 flagellar biosynthesis protein FlhF [Betaproteobacteria bacterium]MDE2624683.1 flagellar biosynthesis protein FlhF [Betaproteobacteria bacterium]
MSMKTFLGANSREALRQVRAELGEDAVILSNRKVGDQVEIVAAHHTLLAGLEQQKQGGQHSHGLLSEIRSLQEHLLSQLSSLAKPEAPARDAHKSRVLRSLLKAGFGQALAEQLLERMPEDAGLDWILKVLERNLRHRAGDEEIVRAGGVYALVGPTGVGKTTTTAKLAARAVVRFGADKVGLITTDSYRVGAYEQLRIYGKILGVSVQSVRDADDLQLTLSTLKHKHLVLIDTMGMGQRDSRVLEHAAMLDACGVRRLLLLNATSNLHTLEDVVRVYRSPGIVGCIPTKLDEAVSMGGVLDVVIRHKLVMHFVANGQRVPEDLHEVSIPYLLRSTFDSLDMMAIPARDALELPQSPIPAHAF